MKKKIVFLSLISLMILSFPFLSLAVDDYTLGGVLSGVATNAGYEAVGQDTLTMTIAQFLRGMFTVLGVLFVALVIYAGFLWMTAGGNEEQVAKAKTLLRNAVIGLGIVVLAFSVTYFLTALFTYSTSSYTGH